MKDVAPKNHDWQMFTEQREALRMPGWFGDYVLSTSAIAEGWRCGRCGMTTVSKNVAHAACLPRKALA